MTTTTKTTLEQAIRERAILPLYETWQPEMMAAAAEYDAACAAGEPRTEAGRRAYQQRKMVGIRIRGRKAYPSYGDAYPEPAAVSSIVAAIDGMTAIDEAGDKIVIDGDQVLINGNAIMPTAKMLEQIHNLPAAWIA